MGRTTRLCIRDSLYRLFVAYLECIIREAIPWVLLRFAQVWLLRSPAAMTHHTGRTHPSMIQLESLQRHDKKNAGQVHAHALAATVDDAALAVVGSDTLFAGSTLAFFRFFNRPGKAHTVSFMNTQESRQDIPAVTALRTPSLISLLVSKYPLSSKRCLF